MPADADGSLPGRTGSARETLPDGFGARYGDRRAKARLRDTPAAPGSPTSRPPEAAVRKLQIPHAADRNAVIRG